MIYNLDSPSLPSALVGSFFFMYPYNRCVIRRSWWLSRLPSSSITSSNETEGDEPRHIEGLVYRESMQMPNGFIAGVFSGVVFGFLGLFLASSLVRPLPPTSSMRLRCHDRSGSS